MKIIYITFIILILLIINLWFSIFWIHKSIMLFLIIALFLFTVVALYRASKFSERDKEKCILAVLIYPFIFIFLFAQFYYSYPKMIDIEGVEQLSKIDAIYFSIVTWTTLGYGDIKPLGFMKIFASIEGLLGYLYSGIIIVMIFKFMNRLEILNHNST